MPCTADGLADDPAGDSADDGEPAHTGGANDLGDLSIKAQLRAHLGAGVAAGDRHAIAALAFIDSAERAAAQCRAGACTPKNCLHLCGRRRW